MIDTFLSQPTTRLKRTRAFQKGGLIFNPVAGQGDETHALATIKSFLEPHIKLDIYLTTPDIGADSLAQEAIAQGADLIIAAGGDGIAIEG